MSDCDPSYVVAWSIFGRNKKGKERDGEDVGHARSIISNAVPFDYLGNK